MTSRIALFGFSLCTAVAVQASTTAIFPSPSGAPEQILETVYGGDFQPSGLDFVDGVNGLSATRFDDSLNPGGMLSLLTAEKGDASDQVWNDADISARAIWRSAAFSQQFGFDRGNGFEFLFNVDGSNENVTGSASVDLTGETWRWVRRNEGGANSWSSDPALNPDFLDHMVTYKLTGLNRAGVTYLLFFEDLYGPHVSEGGFSDRDFNDVVIEIYATPEPASALLLAVGAVTVLRRRR